jgi:hypothetical protein
MLKVLGSLRLTLALIGVVAFLFVAFPPFQPPADTPVKTGNGSGQAVLSAVTNIPEQAQAVTVPASASTASSSNAGSDSSPDSLQTVPTLQPVSIAHPTGNQAQQPTINVTPPSNLQPVVQQVAAPLAQPVKKVVDTVTKPICVNTKLLLLKLDTCLQI